MSVRVRVLGPLVLLLGFAAIAPLSANAAALPAPRPEAAAPAASCPLAANNDTAGVGSLAPTRIDVLANDCVGAATASRPLTITAVGQGTYGSVATDGATVTYDPRACATGNDLFSYTINDGGLVSKTGYVVVTINRPPSAPVTDAPQVGFIANSTIATTVPVSLSWCGVTATGSSVGSYRFEQSTDGGATFPSLLAPATGATSTTRAATVGANYAWRIQTTDTHAPARTGAFASSLASKVTRYQDNGGQITYTGAWSVASSANYSGGKEHYATSVNARATLTVSNVRTFAIVGSRGKGRGGFNVYVDGTKVTTSAISQKATSTALRRVLYIRNLTSGAGVTHTIVVRPAGNGRIDLDAILTLSGRQDQAITFSTPPTTPTYAGAAYNVSASASSGLPVSLKVNSTAWTVCALNAGVVTFHGAGTCRIDATQSGDLTWNARTTSQTFTVAKKALTVSGVTASDRAYNGGTAATVDATGATLGAGVESGDVVTLVTGGATGSFADANVGTGKTVQVAGLTLSGAAAGKYQITQPTTTASITALPVTITFTVANRTYNGTTAATITGCTFAPKVSGDAATCDDSGASASFADPNAGAGKTVTGTDFALTGADAGNYSIDDVDDATATISKASQTVSFTSSAPSSASPSDTYTPTATATSGLTVTITVDASSAAVCSIAAGEVTMDDEGTCKLNANQAGDANRNAAPQVQQSFTVDKLAQSITFDLSGPTAGATYGDVVSIAGTATATSGLTVSFSSLTTGICTVSGSNVTLVGNGTCTISASQAGNTQYAAAANVGDSFGVSKREITVTAVADTKTADGNTSSNGIPDVTSGSLAPGDSGEFIQVFGSAAAGTNKTLTPSGPVKRGATNVSARYDITFVQVTTGVIEPGPADETKSTVTASPTTLDADGVSTSEITVRLKDQYNNFLVASGGTVTILADGGTVSTVTDNLDGTYTATYTSDTSVGMVTVSADLDAQPITDTATINQTAP